MTTLPTVVTRWHELITANDPSGLDTLIADDSVFRSPAVHTPQEGKAKVVAVVDGLQVHGIDMIKWNDDDLITGFTVMVRPLKGLNALIQRMGEQLQKGST